MPKPALALLGAFIVIAAFFVGAGANERRHQVDNGFCRLDTTLVKFIDQSLKATPDQARLYRTAKYRKPYARAYALDIALVRDLVAQSPCEIRHKTPPSVLTHKTTPGARNR